MTRAVVPLLALVCAYASAANTTATARKTAPQAKAVDFQKDIRPILSDACFHCHGPDKGTRMAALRLDTRDGALEARKNGAPVVPGNPQASLIYQRIIQPKVALRMPPQSSHKTLTDEQKETIRLWIQQGAPWKEHWAFSAPKRGTLPRVSNPQWARNPMDRFVMARLDEHGLRPAAEADRRTLARRAALDLTGLPPEPALVEQFLADKSPRAYEAYVDRLLASPRWGEHRARYWLDVARYGDTHGVHLDNYREMWPYRDWVINAFNQNMRFDRFTIEQLAGDLLPAPTMEQLIATGFHRANTTTNEQGVIFDEVDAIYAKDRVDTTGAAWMGLTVGCATCHDHKFDPILQKDFYSLAAFFRNTTQFTMDDNIPDTPPVIVVPTAQDRPRWDTILASASAARKRMAELEDSSEPAMTQWLDSGAYRKIPAPVSERAEWLTLQVDKTARVRTPDETVTLDLKEGVAIGDASTAELKALQFDKKGSVELPPVYSIEPERPFSISVWFYLPRGGQTFVLASQSDPKDHGRGWSLSLANSRPVFRLTGDEDSFIAVGGAHMDQLRGGAWNHLTAIYDGSRNSRGLILYVDGNAIATQSGRDQDEKLEGCFANSQPVLLAKEASRGFSGGAIGDFRIYGRALTQQEARALGQWPLFAAAQQKAPAAFNTDQSAAVRAMYLRTQNVEYQDLSRELARLDAEAIEIRKRGAITHVMQERRNSSPFAHVLYRGMYDQPREKVLPDTPSALPSMSPSMPRNRLGLAQWLVDPANPLTSRVIVNRFWQEIFGTGLVKTAEDFGSQGEVPANQALLDWLAVDFRESGWDIKHLFRSMVTSAAYRQAAVTTPEKLKADPDNRMLSRGPRFRMDGEMVRDLALASSGLLSDDIGGPSVRPYQPPGIWEAVAMLGSNTRFYKRDSGEALYRRSLYTFWKRGAPPASLEIFNAPSRETCTARRERTNTPLQALVLMNDTQFVEASRVLAQSALEKGTAFDDRIDYISQRVISRAFDAREREILQRAYKRYADHYSASAQDREALLATGESPRDPKVDASELAAWTMVASEVLNLDEAVSK